MTAHVRWPGKTGGAIGFALNFLLLLFFVSRQRKVNSGVGDLNAIKSSHDSEMLSCNTSDLKLQTSNQ
jgi:hypothetical protein